MMISKEKGFTLIELMSVVAVIAILVSVSLGSYRNYIIRSQISEPITVATVIKESVGQTFMHQGAFPANNTEAGITNVSSKYIDSVEVEDGAIQIRLGNQIHAQLINQILTLRPAYDESNPSSAVAWICGYSPVPAGWTASGEDKTTIPAKFLPANCRN